MYNLTVTAIMKTVYLIFALLFVEKCLAQIPIGFKAGVNLNQIIHRDMPSNIGEERKSYVTSYHVGIFTRLKLSEKFTFTPELQFVEKGGELNSYNGLKIKLHYIELPLLVSYSPVKWLSIEGGGSIGLNIGNDGYNDKLYRSTDIGALGGLRFNLTKKLSLLSRYYYGVAPIEKFTLSFGDELKAYNENLFFSLSYYLK